jgi:hypothetical protein
MRAHDRHLHGRHQYIDINRSLKTLHRHKQLLRRQALNFVGLRRRAPVSRVYLFEMPVCAVLRATMNKTGQFTKNQYEKAKKQI